jgi:hypothetical protein
MPWTLRAPVTALTLGALLAALVGCVADTIALEPGLSREATRVESCADAAEADFVFGPRRVRSLWRVREGLLLIDEEGGPETSDPRLGAPRSGQLILVDPLVDAARVLTAGRPDIRLLDLWPRGDQVVVLLAFSAGPERPIGVRAVAVDRVSSLSRELASLPELGVTTLFGVDDTAAYLHELPVTLNGDSTLWRLPLAGGALERITSIHGIRAPQISGDTIYFLAPTTPRDFGTMRGYSVPLAARELSAKPLGDVRCTGWLRATDDELYCTERTGAEASSQRQVSRYARDGSGARTFFDLTLAEQRDGVYLGPFDADELYVPTNGARIDEVYPFRVIRRSDGRVRLLTCQLGKIGFRQHGAEPELAWDEDFVYWIETRREDGRDLTRVARAARR